MNKEDKSPLVKEEVGAIDEIQQLLLVDEEVASIYG